MATLVLQAQPPHHHARMQVFKGDQDHLLDKLIAASQLREVSLDSLQERTLVPYFDASDASTASYLATQPGRIAKQAPPAHGLKRHAHERSSAHLAGSPPKKEAELQQARHQRRGKHAASSGSASPASSSGGKGSASTSNSNSDTEMSSTPARKARVLTVPAQARKHSRDTTTTTAPRASSGAQRATPPPAPKRPSNDQASLDMRQLAAASAAAAASLRTPGKSGARTPPCPSKFAGPAFTNSPTPDCLPLPTSSLLFQDAADSLRSRLTL